MPLAVFVEKNSPACERLPHLGFAGGAAGVEDKERVLCIQPLGLTFLRGVPHGLIPPNITLWVPGGLNAPQQEGTNQTHKPDHYSCLPSTPAGVQHANFNSNLECPEELKAKYLEKYDRTIFLVLKYIFSPCSYSNKDINMYIESFYNVTNMCLSLCVHFSSWRTCSLLHPPPLFVFSAWCLMTRHLVTLADPLKEKKKKSSER